MCRTRFRMITLFWGLYLPRFATTLYSLLPMSSFRENAIRLLFGCDIFISYSRADSATYAARLASELTALGFFCRLDQWGANPRREVPPELLRDLRRSSMLVVVGSAASATSSAVETEIREFLPTKRFIVPVNIDGAIRSARWWPLLEGLAVVEEPLSGAAPAGTPSAETVERIQNTAVFTRRTTRLRNFSVAALLIFAGLTGLAVVAGKRATSAKAVADSRELARQANAQTENKSRSQIAIRAVETAPTDAALSVLSDAIRRVIDTIGPGPHAVNTRGDLVALAGRHGQGVLMDLNSGHTTQLCGSPEPIGLLSFSPDSKYLLTARFYHTPTKESGYRPIWEYQLWDTTAGVSLGSAQVEWFPKEVIWAPDSSMFLALQMEKTYRVNIEPLGRLRATEQPIKGNVSRGHGILFSEDQRLFLTYGHVNTDGVSLWDYDGNELWSSESKDVV